jgi:hypothetical protein
MAGLAARPPENDPQRRLFHHLTKEHVRCYDSANRTAPRKPTRDAHNRLADRHDPRRMINGRGDPWKFFMCRDRYLLNTPRQIACFSQVSRILGFQADVVRQGKWMELIALRARKSSWNCPRTFYMHPHIAAYYIDQADMRTLVLAVDRVGCAMSYIRATDENDTAVMIKASRQFAEYVQEVIADVKYNTRRCFQNPDLHFGHNVPWIMHPLRNNSLSTASCEHTFATAIGFFEQPDSVGEPLTLCGRQFPALQMPLTDSHPASRAQETVANFAQFGQEEVEAMRYEPIADHHIPFSFMANYLSWRLAGEARDEACNRIMDLPDHQLLDAAPAFGVSTPRFCQAAVRDIAGAGRNPPPAHEQSKFYEFLATTNAHAYGRTRVSTARVGFVDDIHSPCRLGYDLVVMFRELIRATAPSTEGAATDSFRAVRHLLRQLSLDVTTFMVFGTSETSKARGVETAAARSVLATSKWTKEKAVKYGCLYMEQVHEYADSYLMGVELRDLLTAVRGLDLIPMSSGDLHVQDKLSSNRSVQYDLPAFSGKLPNGSFGSPNPTTTGWRPTSADVNDLTDEDVGTLQYFHKRAEQMINHYMSDAFQHASSYNQKCTCFTAQAKARADYIETCIRCHAVIATTATVGPPQTPVVENARTSSGEDEAEESGDDDADDMLAGYADMTQDVLAEILRTPTHRTAEAMDTETSGGATTPLLDEQHTTPSFPPAAAQPVDCNTPVTELMEPALPAAADRTSAASTSADVDMRQGLIDPHILAGVEDIEDASLYETAYETATLTSAFPISPSPGRDSDLVTLMEATNQQSQPHETGLGMSEGQLPTTPLSAEYVIASLGLPSEDQGIPCKGEGGIEMNNRPEPVALTFSYHTSPTVSVLGAQEEVSTSEPVESVQTTESPLYTPSISAASLADPTPATADLQGLVAQALGEVMAQALDASAGAQVLAQALDASAGAHGRTTRSASRLANPVEEDAATTPTPSTPASPSTARSAGKKRKEKAQMTKKVGEVSDKDDLEGAE